MFRTYWTVGTCSSLFGIFGVCFFLFWRTYQNIRILTNTMELVYTSIQIIIIRKISDYIEVMIVLYFFSFFKAAFDWRIFFYLCFAFLFCSSSFEWERFNNSFFWVSQFSLSLLLQLIDKKKCLKTRDFFCQMINRNQITLSHSRLFRWLLWMCSIRMCRCVQYSKRDQHPKPRARWMPKYSIALQNERESIYLRLLRIK